MCQPCQKKYFFPFFHFPDLLFRVQCNRHSRFLGMAPSSALQNAFYCFLLWTRKTKSSTQRHTHTGCSHGYGPKRWRSRQHTRCDKILISSAKSKNRSDNNRPGTNKLFLLIRQSNVIFRDVSGPLWALFSHAVRQWARNSLTQKQLQKETSFTAMATQSVKPSHVQKVAQKWVIFIMYGKFGKLNSMLVTEKGHINTKRGSAWPGKILRGRCSWEGCAWPVFEGRRY